MRIPLRRRKPGMAKNFLDRAQIRSLLQHVRTERVAKGVRMNIRGKTMRERHLLHDTADAAGSQAAISSQPNIQQQRLRCPVRVRQLL